MIICDLCKKETYYQGLTMMSADLARFGVNEVCSDCESKVSGIIDEIRKKHSDAEKEEIRLKFDEIKEEGLQ